MGKIFWLISTVCAIWVIYDVWEKQKQMDKTLKIVWTAAAIVFNVLTAIVYYFLVKSKE